MKKSSLIMFGFLIGTINIVLGAGGGIVTVPLLKHCNMSQKQAQANAIAIIFPLSIISLIIYFYNGYVNFNDNISIFPFAIIGSILGTLIFKKISSDILKRIFGAFMIYSGVRLLFRL
ncbi:MAG: sulfite exporter TauE/SafE family protein [Oscillospiraceae bacterium]